MKLFKTFYIMFMCVLSFFSVFAQSQPHPPEPVAQVNNPAPPPGLPVDENIFILMTIALLFGIYIIYKHKLKQKTTI